MDWLTDPFLLGFQQRALIGGLLAAVMCSVVGTWLVLRGMSFFGDAFVHGVLPGIALAVVLGGNVHVGAAVAAAVMLAGVSLVHRATTLKEDTAIGLLFVGMMALGVVISSLSDSYTGSLTSILFGDALGVTPEGLRIQAWIGAAVVLMSLVLYRPLLALSFSEAKAAVDTGRTTRRVVYQAMPPVTKSSNTPPMANTRWMKSRVCCTESRSYTRYRA